MKMCQLPPPSRIFSCFFIHASSLILSLSLASCEKFSCLYATNSKNKKEKKFTSLQFMINPRVVLNLPPHNGKINKEHWRRAAKTTTTLWNSIDINQNLDTLKYYMRAFPIESSARSRHSVSKCIPLIGKTTIHNNNDVERQAKANASERAAIKNFPRVYIISI